MAKSGALQLAGREQAIEFLKLLEAPPRLIRHGELVAEVAEELSGAITRQGVEHDKQFLLAGAILHDAGKVVVPAELTRPGRAHEVAGEQLLLRRGVSPKLAQVCRTHGQPDGEEVTLEERLVALADTLWKGERGEQIEKLVVHDVARHLAVEDWDIFLRLDSDFERIAVGGDERLARARAVV